MLITTFRSLKDSLPSFSLFSKTLQSDETESHKRLLNDMEELIRSQQEEHAKRTTKLLQQQMNENEKQDNIGKKLDNQKQTFDEQFDELRTQCVDIKTKVDNQEKQQELLLKLILDLSKEDSATGGPS